MCEELNAKRDDTVIVNTQVEGTQLVITQLLGRMGELKDELWEMKRRVKKCC